MSPTLTERNNQAFDTVLFGSLGYLVGAVSGRQYWSDEKRWAMRFRGVDAATLLARSLATATVTRNYFDDAVDPAILMGME